MPSVANALVWTPDRRRRRTDAVVGWEQDVEHHARLGCLAHRLQLLVDADLGHVADDAGRRL